MLALLQRYLRSTSATRTSALLDELVSLLALPVDATDASLFSSALLDAVTARGSRARGLSAVIVAAELSPAVFAPLCEGASVFAQLAVGAGAFSTAPPDERELAAALLWRWLAARAALSGAPRLGALETAVAYVETRGAARPSLSDEDLPNAGLIRAARERVEPRAGSAGGDSRKRGRDAESPPVPDARGIILACSIHAEAAETLLSLLNPGGGGGVGGAAGRGRAVATAAAAPVFVDEDGEGFIWGDGDDDDEWEDDATHAGLSAGAPKGFLDCAPASSTGVDGDARASLRDVLIEVQSALSSLSSLDAQLRGAATNAAAARHIEIVSAMRGRLDAAVTLAASLGVVAPNRSAAAAIVREPAASMPVPAAVSLDEALEGALAKAVKKRKE